MSSATVPSILGLLTWGPMTGYELKKSIEDSIGNFWSESFGQIYPELRRLEERGLIEAQEIDGATSVKAKRRFSITGAGRQELARWLGEPPRQRPPRNELLLKIFFARHGELTRIINHVRETLESHRKKRAHLQSKEASLLQTAARHPSLPFWLMTLRNGLATHEAMIAWCEETIRQLEALDKPA